MMQNASVSPIRRNLEHATFINNFLLFFYFLRKTEQNWYTLGVSNILRARDMNLKSFWYTKIRFTNIRCKTRV
jgi:hypothetical protein